VSVLLDNFDDLYGLDDTIKLEENIYASIDEVIKRIKNKEEQSGKWREYIERWEKEGRI